MCDEQLPGVLTGMKKNAHLDVFFAQIPLDWYVEYAVLDVVSGAEDRAVPS